MASKDCILNGLEFLSAAFDKRIDDDRKLIYVSLLADLPDGLYSAAVKHCAATLTFLPVPGEIRNAAAHLGKLANGVPSADEAWAELINRAHAPRSVLQTCPECARLDAENTRLTAACAAAAWERDAAAHDALLAELNQVLRAQHSRRACDACQQVSVVYQFSHPLIGECAARLGWPHRFWSGELGVDRGRFIKTYEQLIARRTDEAVLIPAVRTYIEQHHQLADERRAMLETGERSAVFATNELTHQLARR